MPLLLLSEQTLNAKVQQPQSLPYLRCNIPRKALQECQQLVFELMPPHKELHAPRHGNRQQCEGRVEKQEGSHRSQGVRQSPVTGLRGALGFQVSSSFLQAVSKAAAVAILVPGRVRSSGYFAEETPRRCGGY